MIPLACLVASSMLAAVPPRSETLVMGVLVGVVDAAHPEPLGTMWINRTTWNRLRKEAGVSPQCDNRGLGLVVVAGPGAVEWGMKPGGEVTLQMLEGGLIPVPLSILPDESWFLRGLRPGGNPCPSGGPHPTPAAPGPQP